MRIAIDVMGGDNAPASVLDGCRLFLSDPAFSDAHLALFGAEEELKRFLSENPFFSDRVSTYATSEIIDLNEPPVMAYKKKKDSSLVRAFESVKAGECDCILSAGSTGAILTGATLTLRRQKGIKRPALATLLPTMTGGCVLLLDCGANTDCKPSYLQQFALMGKAYMQCVAGVSDPRIALLSNGAEEEKGNALTKEAHERLSKMEMIRFIGNAEARDLMSGDCDVLVCDGFDGNVLLKGVEGASKMIMTLLKNAMYSTLRNKIGGLIASPAFKSVKKQMDYKEYGGAPLLGVNGGVVKAHGSSDGKAIYSALKQAFIWTKEDLVRVIGDAVSQIQIEDD